MLFVHSSTPFIALGRGIPETRIRHFRASGIRTHEVLVNLHYGKVHAIVEVNVPMV